MKKMNRLLLCLLLSLLAMQCKEEKPEEEVNQLDLLPAATQSGRYTFGCLVNGKAWVPRTTTDMGAFYQGGLLQISAKAYNKPGEQNMALVLYNPPEEDTSYDLTKYSDQVAEYISRGIDVKRCVYEKDSTLSGSLTITHFDAQNYIVSGKFEFTTVADGCDTVRVTDGRFDLPYTP